MSEFECKCGRLMVRDKKTGKLKCEFCGSNRVHYMDGRTSKEIYDEDEYYDEENEEEYL